MQIPSLVPPPEPSIDQGPYVNVAQDGMLAAVGNERPGTDEFQDPSELNKQTSDMIMEKQDQELRESRPNDVPSDCPTQEPMSSTCAATCHSATSLIKRRLDQISRHSRKSIWLLAYVAIVSSWPLVGSAFYFFFRTKIKKSLLPASLQKK